MTSQSQRRFSSNITPLCRHLLIDVFFTKFLQLRDTVERCRDLKTTTVQRRHDVVCLLGSDATSEDLGSSFHMISQSESELFENEDDADDHCNSRINPMGIAPPRDVHETSLLGPSLHVPYWMSIGRPFSVHCSRVDGRLIWTSNGRPKVAQSTTSNFSYVTLLFK